MKIADISSISQDHVSKLSETAEPSTLQRLEGLEIEQRSKKEHFEKLVKYCESCLQGLKDDLDEHVSELRSEVATATGRSSEVEGGLNLSALSERMDQLWSKCTEWDLGFRELQWKVSKLSEQILGRKNLVGAIGLVPKQWSGENGSFGMSSKGKRCPKRSLYFGFVLISHVSHYVD